MSKKTQHNKQPHKAKQPALDQDNQPFLRVLHKKIRNINKRLTEIAELQQKDNLKPEQLDKIQRKQHLIDERQKLQDNIQALRQAYSENIELFRAHQLKEIELLARSLAVYMTHPQFADHAKLAKLWSGIQEIKGNNLNESISHIVNVLKQISNDYKLQKALTSLVSQNGEKAVEKKVPTTFTHTDQIIIVKENIVNEKGEVDKIEIVEKIHDGKIEEVTIIVNDQIKRQEPQSPPPTPVDIPTTQTHTQPELTTNTETPQQPENAAETTESRPNQISNNNRPNYKGERREYKGQKRGEGRRRYNDGQRGQKRTYKPKQYRENYAKEQRQASHSQQEEQARNFKKEEIKQLEQDGFIVVGKPKPKPQQYRKNYRNKNEHKVVNN